MDLGVVLPIMIY